MNFNYYYYLRKCYKRYRRYRRYRRSKEKKVMGYVLKPIEFTEVFF